MDPDLFTNGLEQRLVHSRWTAECINADLYRNFGIVIKATINYCIEKHWIPERDVWYYVFLVVCVFVVLFSIFSTWKMLTLNPVDCDNEDKMFLRHWLEAFSIENNIKRLVSPSLPVELSFLHTLKFLTIFAIVGGHTILFSNVFPVSNPEYIEHVSFKPIFTTVDI